MSTRNNHPGDDRILDRNQGYDDWPPPDDFRGIKLAVLGLLLLGVLGVGGWLAYNTLVPKDPRDLALDHLEDGNYRTAITELNGLVQQYPNDAELRWLLGKAHSQLNESAYARSHWEAAYEMGYHQRPLLLALTNSRLIDGEDEAALAMIRQWSALETGDALASWEVLHARVLLNMGRKPLATEAFARALRSDPGNLEAKRGLAYTGISAELVAAVGADVEEALTTGLDQPETWVLKGELEFTRGDLDAAGQSFVKAAEIGPNNVYALTGLARVYLATGQLDAAAEPIASLTQRFPRHAGGAYVRALYAQQREEYRQALDILRIVLSQDPNHSLSLLLMGEVQQAMGNNKQALLNLSRFHRMAPDNVRGRKSLASAYLENGQPGRAVEILEPLVEQQRTDPESAALLATAYTRLGNMDMARVYEELARDTP
jgi:tetratricopeptide (TPR) repeat protein